jgi:hypothetical protein
MENSRLRKVSFFFIIRKNILKGFEGISGIFQTTEVHLYPTEPYIADISSYPGNYKYGVMSGKGEFIVTNSNDRATYGEKLCYQYQNGEIKFLF